MNVSEGRDAALLASVREAIDSTPGAWCLDVSSDADHHRSVLSFIGAAVPIREAALAACRCLLPAVDLALHRGVHPRVGAVDVVPFVPVEAPLVDCIEVARRFGRALWEKEAVPVYYYGAAAAAGRPSDLAVLRPALIRAAAGGPAAPDPDEGRGSHPRAGVTLVGARFPLIAFNVYLDADDLEAARRIAARVRERGGGLKAVRALGLPIPARGKVQVSMNLVHYPTTSIEQAFRRVRDEAAREGLETAGSELIGLAPAAALDEAVARQVELEDFGPHRILENRIEEVVGGS